MVADCLGSFRLPIVGVEESALDPGIPMETLRVTLTGFPEVVRSRDPLCNESLWPDGRPVFICSLKSCALSLKIECDVCFLVVHGSPHENGGVSRRQKETGKGIISNYYK